MAMSAGGGGGGVDVCVTSIDGVVGATTAAGTPSARCSLVHDSPDLFALPLLEQEVW